MCSNVSGFEEAKCLITEGDAEALVKEMVSYMLPIQETAAAYTFEEHQEHYDELMWLLDEQLSMEQSQNEDEETLSEAEEENDSHKGQKIHPLAQIKQLYENWLSELPLIGFNSSKFDVNLIKPSWMKALKQMDPVQFTVKKNNMYMCLKTERLNLLNIRNYLAPGFSDDSYLKVYKCSSSKGYFPYEWLDTWTKLEYPQLPEYEAFYSHLKKCNITREEYAYCQEVWEQKI